MERERRRAWSAGAQVEDRRGTLWPGKRSLTERLPIQRKAAPGAGMPGRADRAFGRATAGAAGEVPYRADMERAFGADFAGVRVHLGRGADLADLGAVAAARGDSVAFASGAPDRETVAHELAHVVQARGAAGSQRGPAVSEPSSAAEREADAVAPRAATGEAVTVAAPPSGGIHRMKGNGSSDEEDSQKDEENSQQDEEESQGSDDEGVSAILATVDRAKGEFVVGCPEDGKQVLAEWRREAEELCEGALKDQEGVRKRMQDLASMSGAIATMIELAWNGHTKGKPGGGFFVLKDGKPEAACLYVIEKDCVKLQNLAAHPGAIVDREHHAGAGTATMAHLVELSLEHEMFGRLKLDAELSAVDFYRKIGCRFEYEDVHGPIWADPERRAKLMRDYPKTRISMVLDDVVAFAKALDARQQ